MCNISLSRFEKFQIAIISDKERQKKCIKCKNGTGYGPLFSAEPEYPCIECFIKWYEANKN